MRDITRNILKYITEILVLLIILVVLARTGSMPVVVPENITDFIIDTTSDIFTGRVFHSFTGFLDDFSDFFLTGGSNKRNIKKINIYKNRVERYFELISKNLNNIGNNPIVRGSLPDFHSRKPDIYIKGFLENIIKNYYDVDQISVINSKGLLISRASKTNSNIFNEKLINKAILNKVKKMHIPAIIPAKNNRIVFITSFSSKMREKNGIIIMVINNKAIIKAFNDVEIPYKNFIYITDKDRNIFISSKSDRNDFKKFTEDVISGRLSPLFINEQSYLTIQNKHRSYLLKLKYIEGRNNQLFIGYLAPEGSIIGFILLILRFGLLILLIWIILYLIKNIYKKLMQISRDKRLADGLMTLSLEKSINANNKISNAAEKAINLASKATNILEESVTDIKNISKKVIIKKEPAIDNKIGYKKEIEEIKSKEINSSNDEFKWSEDKFLKKNKSHQNKNTANDVEFLDELNNIENNVSEKKETSKSNYQEGTHDFTLETPMLEIEKDN